MPSERIMSAMLGLEFEIGAGSYWVVWRSSGPMIPALVSTALVQRGCESDNGDETHDNDTGDGTAGQRGARINGKICGDRSRCSR